MTATREELMMEISQRLRREEALRRAEIYGSVCYILGAVKAVIIFLLATALFGCATLQDHKATAYKSLAGMAITYDTAMKTLAQLEKDGLLTPEEKQKAIEAAVVFWSVWHEAAIVLQIWMNVDTPEAQDKVKEVLQNVLDRYEEMMRYLQPILNRAQK